MKRADQDRLLAGILEDENLAQLRLTSLSNMIRAARARRRQRMIATAAASLAILLALAVFAPWRLERISSVEPVVAPKITRVKFIDDEQLLALFPSRPVALVGPPGNQKLLFLDGTDGVSVESAGR